MSRINFRQHFRKHFSKFHCVLRFCVRHKFQLIFLNSFEFCALKWPKCAEFTTQIIRHDAVIKHVLMFCMARKSIPLPYKNALKYASNMCLSLLYFFKHRPFPPQTARNSNTYKSPALSAVNSRTSMMALPIWKFLHAQVMKRRTNALTHTKESTVFIAILTRIAFV